jgi:hypothetical protein
VQVLGQQGAVEAVAQRGNLLTAKTHREAMAAFQEVLGAPRAAVRPRLGIPSRTHANQSVARTTTAPSPTPTVDNSSLLRVVVLHERAKNRSLLSMVFSRQLVHAPGTPSCCSTPSSSLFVRENLQNLTARWSQPVSGDFQCCISSRPSHPG